MLCYLRSVRLDEFITEFRKSGKAIKEFDRKSPPSALGEKALYLTLSLAPAMYIPFTDETAWFIFYNDM